MAGRKRKPPQLHLLQGSYRPDRHGPLPESEAEPSATLASTSRPKYLRGRAAKLWDEVAGLCWWLDAPDVYKCGMWCALQAEFERGSAEMTAARINALRALGSELGLDPATRARMQVGRRTSSGDGFEDYLNDRQKFFDD